ncbi:M48 family metallopeptidase [Pseudogemmobacter bohemicus]|uniref:M48 family metallopeptidase n=1 Tax=Pseudogemmobacter bohemicus TaxID=2250708 RepID=UPI000DD4C42E|nr:M48 family metallopeptidase [Pseudogemmobacter bohemicus]
MLRLMPFLILIAYGFLMMRFSVWRSKRMLDEQSRPLDDPEIQAVAVRLAAALDLPEVRVNVLEIEPVNGLAAYDGRIFLTRGFLKKKAEGHVSPEELASVIAHELGHVAHGHTRRRMIDFTGQNAVGILLAGILNRFVPGIGGMIANMISRMLMAKLSRRDEFEADAWATALMIRAGYGTAPQISLFRKLAGLTGTGGGEIPVWLRSHPKAEERIAAIEANEARWQRPALSGPL